MLDQRNGIPGTVVAHLTILYYSQGCSKKKDESWKQSLALKKINGLFAFFPFLWWGQEDDDYRTWTARKINDNTGDDRWKFEQRPDYYIFHPPRDKIKTLRKYLGIDYWEHGNFERVIINRAQFIHCQSGKWDFARVHLRYVWSQN